MLKAALLCFALAALTLWLMIGCALTPKQHFMRSAGDQVHKKAVFINGAERSSQIDALNSGERFYANCESFARTAADVLVQEGADPKDIWLVIAHKPNFFGFNHVVVIYEGYVLDNTTRAIRRYQDTRYQWLYMKKLNGSMWIRAVPEWWS